MCRSTRLHPEPARSIVIYRGPVILAQFRLQNGCDLIWAHTGDDPYLFETVASVPDEFVLFGYQLRDRGATHVEAVIESAAIRLRPILMTSFCTAFGSVPLMIASGAGAESRQAIGAAVFFGTMFSLLLTLFVVPALYALLARNTRSPHYVSDLIERLPTGWSWPWAQRSGCPGVRRS